MQADPIVRGDEFTKVLLRALGLEGKRVTHLVLDLEVGKPAVITVTRFVQRSDESALQAIAHYDSPIVQHLRGALEETVVTT